MDRFISPHWLRWLLLNSVGWGVICIRFGKSLAKASRLLIIRSILFNLTDTFWESPACRADSHMERCKNQGGYQIIHVMHNRAVIGTAGILPDFLQNIFGFSCKVGWFLCFIVH